MLPELEAGHCYLIKNIFVISETESRWTYEYFPATTQPPGAGTTGVHQYAQ